MDEALALALVKPLESIEWIDPAEDAALPATGTTVSDPADPESDSYITH